MSETAIQFVHMLKRIGFPQAETMDPASIEWLFENENIGAWLTYLSDNLLSSNVLSEVELKTFAELQESSESNILHGSELENAVLLLNQLGQEISEDELRNDISSLELKVNHSNQEKDLLVRERNRLSLHHSMLGDRLSKLDSVAKLSSQELRQTIEDVQAINKQINSSLLELLENAVRLCSIYTSITPVRDGAAVSKTSDEQRGSLIERSAPSAKVTFFSQLKLDEYHHLEERFTQELTLFTKKLFFEGIAEVAGQNDATRYEFLDVSNPDMLLVRGEKGNVNLDDCAELARIQSLYPKSELLRISALVAERSKAAACAYAESISVSNKHLPHDLNALSSRLREVRSDLNRLQSSLAMLSDRQLPSLVSESAEAQATHILCGDYDLKIARQNYFIDNQDKVIDHLVTQHARTEMLTMVYDVELKGHRDVSRLLSAIRLLLQQSLAQFKSRMVMMEDPSLSASWQQRSTVDSRDFSTARLYQILAPAATENTGRPWLLTYSKLTESADALGNQITQLQASVAAAQSMQASEVTAAEGHVQALQALVYGTSSSASQPVLSPKAVVDGLSQLDSVLQKLEKAVGDVIRDIEQKKVMLKSDNLLPTERELFVYFFTDPERLRRVIDDVSARVKAQQVK